MFTLEEFKNLPINKGINDNEISRKYFIYKSDYFYRNRSFSSSGSNINYTPPSNNYVAAGYVENGYVE